MSREQIDQVKLREEIVGYFVDRGHLNGERIPDLDPDSEEWSLEEHLMLRAYAALAPTVSGGEGWGPMDNVSHAYALLWADESTDKRVHEARRLLLDAIGGQGSEGQKAALAIPTVQAETAVVGEAEAWRVPAGFLIWAHDRGSDLRDCKEAIEGLRAALSQPPVSTGEQPGMSEANEPEPYGYAVEYQDGSTAFVKFDPNTPAEWPFRAVFPPCWQGYAVQTLFATPTIPDDLLSLSEAATAGEWENVRGLVGALVGGRSSWTHVATVVDEDSLTTKESEANASLIVASVNFIRTLEAKQGGRSHD